MRLGWDHAGSRRLAASLQEGNCKEGLGSYSATIDMVSWTPCRHHGQMQGVGWEAVAQRGETRCAEWLAWRVAGGNVRSGHAKLDLGEGRIRANFGRICGRK